MEQVTQTNRSMIRHCVIHGFHTGAQDCHCVHGPETPALEMILGANVIWMVLIRPVVIIMWSPEHLFVDLGSHLMLTIAAVFAPILPQQVLVRQVIHAHINNAAIKEPM